MKWIKIVLIITLAMCTLNAGKVKVFDLNDQILDASGKKVEKFKVNDVTVSTNLSLSQKEDNYIAKKNGYFGIEFDKAENDFVLNFKIASRNDKGTWRFVDELGESLFIYLDKRGDDVYKFTINGKRTETTHYTYAKVTIKNNKLMLYSNNEKLVTVNISNLKGVKAVEFEEVYSVSDFLIVKEK